MRSLRAGLSPAWFALATLAAGTEGALAQAVADAPVEGGGSGLTFDSVGTMPALAAVRLPQEQRPRIDGRLDDMAWAEAAVAAPFVQRTPQPGARATERTEAYVLYDDDALYVAFRCWVRDPATLVAPLVRRDPFAPRDQLATSDRVSVDVDSYGDGRTAFAFGVTAAGVKLDALDYDDTDEDASWDAVWDGAAARFEGGWTAELRIPLGQLRYHVGLGPQAWGIQFRRDIPANGETAYWAPILPDREGYVSRFGRLHGLARLPAPRRVEWVPYVATRLTRAPGDGADPFYNANDLGPSAGFDARLGLSSSLTLTATVNPDFGQVEADPAVVNLTQFETFFEERRPFFVEGVEAFAFGRTRTTSASFRPTFFYSRRIGRAPLDFGLLYPASAYASLDAPAQTTIAAAAKVSGQAHGWSVGLLDALTTREQARFDGGEGGLDALPVEPLTNYAVGRARRGWRGGATLAGAFASGVLRATGDATTLSGAAFGAVLPRAALVAGLDAEHAWAGRAWTASAVVAASRVAGEPGAIGLLQRAPQRYYQRPDQSRLALDPAATSLAGYYAEASLARTGGGRHWRGSLTGTVVSPGFEVNDLGFQTRADAAALNSFVELTDPDGAGPFRWLSGFTNSSLGWNLGGDLIQHAYGGGFGATLRNLWELSASAVFNPEVKADRLTRGGPLAARPTQGQLTLYLASDRSRPVSFGSSLYYRRDGSGEFETRPEFDLMLRPVPALEVVVEPALTRLRLTDQYVTTVEDGTAATFGRRYVFADLRQHVLDLGLRVSWTFTPDLSLQLYAQPFASTAAFSRFKEFTTPGQYAFDVYGAERGGLSPEVVCAGDPAPCDYRPAGAGERPDRYVVNPGGDGAPFAIENPDFRYRSLRGNAVLRWEYRPGSALFLVWQQVRQETVLDASGEVFRDLGDVFRAPVENVFLVKATYWLGL